MSENPYRPSNHAADSALQRFPPAQPRRPLSVTIISVLFLISGGIGLFAIAMMFSLLNKREVAWAMEAVGISSLLVLFVLVFTVAISLAAGGGMLVGAPWGWWLAAFSCLDSVVRHCVAIVDTLRVWSELGRTIEDVAPHLTKFTISIVIGLVFLLWLYKGDVQEYFGLTDFPWWKSFGLVFAAAVVFVIAARGIAALS